MTSDDKKQAATDLLMACAAADRETVAALIHDDFHFQFMENAESWSADGQEFSTRLDKDTFLEHGVVICDQVTQDGMRFTVNVALCDGDYVALFGESSATSLSGKPYNNTYCWRFIFKGDKVVDMQEYCDTRHAREVLFD